MPLEELKRKIRALVANNEMAEAFRVLLEALREEREAMKLARSLSGRYRQAEREKESGTLMGQAYVTEMQQIRTGLLGMTDRLTTDDQAVPATEKTAASDLPHDWHRYTCDRVEQNNRFQQIRRDGAGSRVHFFYIYGLDRHAHTALVERFAYDLEGLLRSQYHSGVSQRCRVEREFDFSLLLNPDPDEYRTDLLTNFFTAFGLDPDRYGPLLETTLHDLLRDSPRLRALGPNDHVCCYLGIPEWDWDTEVTPAAVTWLIDHFCGTNLPPDAPRFFFFFGIEFEDDHSPVRQEVEAAIRAGGNRVHILPELHMVLPRDLKRWFNNYRKWMPDRKQREQLYEQFFGDREARYMEDVIERLGQIIEQLNTRT